MGDIIWKPTAGFEGIYEISNQGDIRSIYREFSYYDPRWDKIVTRKHKSATLKQFVSNSGYKFVSLRKDGKYYQRYIHRLVAQTFIDNPENKAEVNHKDRNKHNNCVNNLEWVTAKENSQHLLHSGYDWGAISRGKSPSAETRAKISAACKGKSGYIRTDETRAKFIKSYCQLVRCITDGKMFACSKDADRYYGYSQVVSTAIRLHRNTKDGKQFEYIPKEEYYAIPL